MREQNEICNRFITEAKKALERKTTRRRCVLYQVYHGMPKHKQFLHMSRRLRCAVCMKQVESMMMTEMRKEEHAICERNCCSRSMSGRARWR